MLKTVTSHLYAVPQLSDFQFYVMKTQYSSITQGLYLTILKVMKNKTK